MSMVLLRHVIDPRLTNLDRFEYLWQDSENFKRPTKMCAPEYIEHLMAWVQSNVDNEQMFPSRIGMFYLVVIRYIVDLLLTRGFFFFFSRCSVPQDLPQSSPSDLQTSIPCLRPHLLPPLPSGSAPRPRASPQHQLQALCLVH